MEAASRQAGLLCDEKQRIEAGAQGIAELTAELERLTGLITAAKARRDEHAQSNHGGGNRVGRSHATAHRGRRLPHDPSHEAATAHFPQLSSHPRPAGHPGRLVRLRDSLTTTLNRQREDTMKKQSHESNKIVGLMAAFRSRYPIDAPRWTPRSPPRLSTGSCTSGSPTTTCPASRPQFKTYLNTNTIRDIASFQSQLNKQAERDQGADRHHQRLAGRHRLQPRPLHPAGAAAAPRTPRSATSAPICGPAPTTRSPATTTPTSTRSRSSCRSRRIIERFSGREGQTEADRQWTRRVTDVRNWFMFSASERWREDDTEHEHYADSGGKSGGQKEKLAYTILAASLAYQFKLEWGAGSRGPSGSSSSTRPSAAARTSRPGSRSSCSRRLGLQLLIVTPLQKIHVIEPYVSAVGFVDNPTGDYSRLQTLTIEEYRPGGWPTPDRARRSRG